LSELKIGFFTPYYKSNRGNATTTRRIIHGLNEAGVNTSVFPYLEEPWSEEKERQLADCHILHIIHLYRFTRWNMSEGLTLNKPYILTNGGTDINHDIANLNQGQEMSKLVEGSSFITVFTKDATEKLLNVYPDQKDKIKIIPQSVWFEESKELEAIRLPKVGPIIFLPAGIRKVKDPLYIWEEIKALKQIYKELQFIIAGVAIEDELYKQILLLCQQHEWVHFYENVPFSRMEQLYRQSDITINTSISEGQSSALLEAMYCGSPLIVRKNEGNLSIVTHGETGFVYDKSSEFLNYAKTILNNQKIRETTIAKAKEFVLANHSLKEEIKHYISLYNQLT
jgi:glycosyltransferase involved in cell wall biosynthesis